MKKIFSSLFVIAATAVMVNSCAKQETKEVTDSNTKTVTFTAKVPQTKTTFGTLADGKYPTIWTDNDSQIYIAQNYSDGVAATVSKTSDTEASFTVTLTDDESGSYTFYALSPSSARVSGVNSNYKSWNLEIPTSQTSTTTGPDEKAMVMVATSSTTEEFPDNVEFEFKHVTAYGKMTIKNLSLDEGDEIASVTITGSDNIAYRYYYYVGGDNAGTLSASNGQKAITVNTSSTDDIWFGCAPIAKGTTLSLEVTTTGEKIYKKSIETPAALEAGHIAVFSVDFTGISSAADVVYNLVTSADEITTGSKIIIAAAGDYDYAMGSVGASYVSQTAATKSTDDKTITNPSSSVTIFTVAAGNVDESFALQFDNNGTTSYLSGASTTKNKTAIVTTLSDDASWKVDGSIDSTTGSVILVCCGTGQYKYLRYNAASNGLRFAAYNSSTSQKDIAIYKLAE